MAADVNVSHGLTAEQVQERVAAGRVNEVPAPPSRTLAEIIRANVFTRVNAIIGTLLVLILIAEGGPSPDMLFAGVIIANSVIGTVQELRARAALHRIAVLQEPVAIVLRDGMEYEIDVEQVVADDLLVLRPGVQVVVDAVVAQSTGLEVDESLLTGESDAVHKAVDDEVLSGSFVTAGSAQVVATRIGAASYSATLAEEARRFSLVASDLREGVNRILRFLMFLIPPIAAILLWRLLAVGDDWRTALSGVVAASVAMVPDGLVLLTSVAFMAGVIALARRQALVRELASVELLARVDTLCLDKTGTLTTGEIEATGVELCHPEIDETEVLRCLAALAASDPAPNATGAAIAARWPDVPDWPVVWTVPFSSLRKWSAAAFSDRVLYLGAPEFLAGDDERVAAAVGVHAAQGRRVVLLAHWTPGLGDAIESLVDDDRSVLPEGLEAMCLVVLADEVRDDAAGILSYFVDQGVDLKVISGDNPQTVAAVAMRAGVPHAEVTADGRELPDDPEALAEAVLLGTVFGRVSPQQKQSMVRALQSKDRVVAMTGDGVNDVLALKDADMGIAMGAGSAASRAVAQLVLLDNRFSVLPHALAEGRRVINSVERAANLFIYGTVYAVITSIVIAAAGTEFPYLPRHLTLVRSLSVGIPGFVLALAPDPRPVRPDFVPRVLRFSIPAGALAAAASLTVFLVGRSVGGVTLVAARSAATITLLCVGLVILLRLTRSLPPWRWILVGCMAAAVAVVLAVPALSTFFELEVPPTAAWLLIAVVTALAAAGLQNVSVGVDE